MMPRGRIKQKATVDTIGISKDYASGSYLCTRATLSTTGKVETNGTIYFYLSNDGTTWESVTDGVEHTFTSSPDGTLRWKTVMHATSPDAWMELDTITMDAWETMI
jgi:hypothetical protein